MYSPSLPARRSGQDVHSIAFIFYILEYGNALVSRDGLYARGDKRREVPQIRAPAHKAKDPYAGFGKGDTNSHLQSAGTASRKCV